MIWFSLGPVAKTVGVLLCIIMILSGVIYMQYLENKKLKREIIERDRLVRRIEFQGLI